MKLIERMWYQSYPLYYLFIPFSYLFRAIVYLRRISYRFGILKSYRFSVPIIVVGNINVGGTGKTPLVIHLVKTLQAKGYKPGVVSRGYGGTATQYPLLLNENHDATVADEALLIYEACTCPVVIDPKRARAVRHLLANTECNIVISDDGLQHYALARDVEISVIDASRAFGNGHCFPAGPLREPISRLKTVDSCVVNGKPTEALLKQLPANVTTMQLNIDKLINVKDPKRTLQLTDLSGEKIHAVAGIGNPQRFFDSLMNHNLDIVPHAFPDHYNFCQQDLAFVENEKIIMTAKDAIKCREFADERYWYLVVDAVLDCDVIDF